MHWVGGMITLAMLLLCMIIDFSPTITFSEYIMGGYKYYSSGAEF